VRAIVADEVRPAAGPLRGSTHVPGDKSISHRLAIVAAVARGPSRITGFSPADDCEATLRALRHLGVGVVRSGDQVTIRGRGWDGLRHPSGPVRCTRSATTMRLLTAVLAGSRIRAVLTGDPQLLRRPMDRVAEPLRRMGARVETTAGRPPIVVTGGPLAAMEHHLPVASAQVKSAILLAGLRARGTTTVTEPAASRDHTERLLAWLGVPVAASPGRVEVRGADLPPLETAVPGDPSSAAPLLAAAALVPGSDVTVEGVGLNPTRTAFLRVLERMGAAVEARTVSAGGPEPVGDVTVRSAPLRATEVRPEEVPAMIDELPLVGILAAVAQGRTVVRGASELRVKESDRIAALVAGLGAQGVEAEELPDGFAVRGPAPFPGGEVDAAGDHRMAMAFAVAALRAETPLRVRGMDRVADSFPGFLDALEALR
jgi:3-phosphoshikimate 1-carboxyvinyltransferase